MKNLKNIYRWAVCVGLVAMVVSVPGTGVAKKNNSQNSGSDGSSAPVAYSTCAGSPSSNAATTATASYNTDAIVIPANNAKWHTISCTTIKNPAADDDLFINVSQVTRITTTTVTFSSTANLVSSGNAKLQMRFLVDGVEAKPGAIVFDERLMTLTSSLQSFLSLSCTNTPTAETIITTSCV